MALETQVAQRISRLYFIAIALIALLTLLAQGFLQLYLYNLSFDSREINLAGKMRMLSQRTVKLGLLIERGDDAPTHRRQLAETTQELTEIFDGLANGSEILGLQPPGNKTLAALFSETGPTLNTTITAANTLANADPGTKPFAEALALLVGNDDALLEMIARIPAAYDEKASADVQRLVYIELGLLLVTLTILLLELRFIFRPILQIALDALAQVEKDAIEAQNLKRLASMGEMSGGIAHELNSPLAALSFAIQRLQRRMKRGKGVAADDLVAQLDNMSNDALRMGEIIQSVRALAAGKLPESKKTHPVEDIFGATIDNFRQRYGRSSLPITVKPGSESAMVFCVHYQVEQVLTNLIKNAAEATEDLQEPWVELSARTSREGTHLTVRDAGSGIPAHVLDRAFDPFFSTKDVGGGMGLGLALCQKLTELHGGTLDYQLIDGHTAFTLFFPAGVD